MRAEKCRVGAEIEADALNAIVSKALGLPKAGTHVGRGPHVTMPQTWDGQGKAPPGWTKQQEQVWVASASDAVLPIPDTLAAQLQTAPVRARLSGAEIVQLDAAIAARVMVDLEVGSYVPKASAVAVAEAEPLNETDTKGKS